MNDAALLAFDRKHLWHPYDDTSDPTPVNCAVRAEGVWIETADGTRWIDAVSSWWCMAHGHGHPAICAAIERQLAAFSQVMFAGFTHRPAVELAEKLLAVAPAGMERVFFSDSGSIAAEVAIKMALQYQYSTGHQSRQKLLTVRGGYHGDTLGTMALGDPDGMHHYFAAMLPQNFFVPAPPIDFGGEWVDAALDPVREMLAAHESEIAGIMLEPIFQGAGGMRFYHPNYLKGVRALCDRYGILLILDEIATGFGRTGRFFASEYAGIAPDILCVGKALTGGAITLAATLATGRVASGIASGKPGRLMHGPTFMANPLACAAGCASLELFATGQWRPQVEAIEAQLRRELAPGVDLPNVASVRSLGAIGVIELKKAVPAREIMELLRQRGVWLRPFGNYLYTMPPFIITPEELTRVTGAMLEIAAR